MSAGGGAMSPCPHCRSTAAAERSPSLRWRCAVCGGPLVPTSPAQPRSGAELADLVAAQRANAIRGGWRAAFGLAAAVAGGLAGLTLLLWHASVAAGTVLASLAVAATLLSMSFSSRARRAEQERDAHLGAAWRSVAAEVLGARDGAMTAPDLAKALSIDEEHAEELLAQLSADGHARIAITDDAEISYRSVDPGSEALEEGDRAEPRGRSREP